MSTSATKHVFAFFWNDLTACAERCKQGAVVFLRDAELAYRLRTIVRCVPGDRCIMFDRMQHIVCEVRAITKKEIQLYVIEQTHNTLYQPEIVCVVPLLKRDALEWVVDWLTQVGCTAIQLVITQKMHQRSVQDKEIERLQRVMIAAAEQSKNFSFPTLAPPVPLHEYVQTIRGDTILSLFCDVEGSMMSVVLERITQNVPAKLFLFIGPEGDFSEQEKLVLQQHNVTSVALTPTILRAEHAAALAVGIVRSVCRRSV